MVLSSNYRKKPSFFSFSEVQRYFCNAILTPLFVKAWIPDLETVFQYLSCCFSWGLFPVYLHMDIYRDRRIWRYISLCSHKCLFSICGAVSCAYSCALHSYPVFSWPLSFGWITAFQNTTLLLINVTNIAGPWMSNPKLRCAKIRVWANESSYPRDLDGFG